MRMKVFKTAAWLSGLTKLIDKESQTDEKAEYEAAVWIIRLADDPGNAELQADFDSWRNKSEQNAKLFDETQQASDLIENTTPLTREQWDAPLHAPQHTPQYRPSEPKASNGFSLTALLNPLLTHWQQATATLALACCLVLVVAPAAQLHWQADYLTTTAEQQTITLSDGSQITLAPESAIGVSFSPDQRHVRLLKGRAFFTVSPNVNRPFSVRAGDTQATVLGTAFDVRLASNGATVAVAQGHVRVSDHTISPTVAEDLRVGDQLRTTWHEGVVRGQTAADEIAAWRQGELVAHNMPMSDIVDALRAYHKGAIVIQSAAFSTLRVSGLYKLNDPIATLNSLANAYGASVTQISPWLLVVND